MKRPLARLRIPLLASLFAIAVAGAAKAQEQSRGDASLRVDYQFIRTGSFFSGSEEFDYWTTDTQVLMLSGDYSINYRRTVFGALPYVRKRFNSEVDWRGEPKNPKDPSCDDIVHPENRLWDDVT